MKKIGILFFCLYGVIAYGQNQPFIWLRADKMCDTCSRWNNLMSDTVYVVKENPITEYSLINYNPALKIGENMDGYSFHFDFRKSNTITAMVVYQTTDTLIESGVWGIKYSDERNMLLTTKEYYTPKKTYHYRDTNELIPIINTLVFNVNKADLDSLCYVSFGKTDSLPFSGKIAEVMFFDKPLRGNNLLKYQSYLAIKYGVTIIDNNYINSDQDTIWLKNSIFKHSIAGIGKDSIMSLNQKQSSSTSDNDCITMGALKIDSLNEQNNYVLNNHQFIIWANNGNNDTNMVTTFDVWGMPFDITSRKWMVQSSGENASGIPIQMIYYSKNKNLKPQDECYLVINREGVEDFSEANVEKIFPDSISNTGKVYFSNINWDIDGNGIDLFAFSVTKVNSNASYSNNSGIPNNENTGNENNTKNRDSKQNSVSSDNNTISQITPNPTLGEFTVQLRGKVNRDYAITIVDSQGRLVKEVDKKQTATFDYNSKIERPGVYFVKITSTDYTKIFKLVVN